MWKTNIGDVKFRQEEVLFLVSAVCFQLEIWDELSDVLASKDKERRHLPLGYLHGISNAEYFYTAYEVLNDLCDDQPGQDQPVWKQAVLCAVLGSAEVDLVDNFDSAGMESWPAEAMIFWDACQTKAGFSSLEPRDLLLRPQTHKQEGRAAWKRVFAQIEKFLVSTPDLRKVPGNFALEDSQPRWPTHQEYRMARAWFLARRG
jgi:hypothetical protein